jgi:hypothetical protein
MAAIVVAYFPVMHGVQTEGTAAPLKAEYFPAEQRVHVELAPNAVEYVPGEQREHISFCVAPSALECVPAGHSRQGDVLPVILE